VDGGDRQRREHPDHRQREAEVTRERPAREPRERATGEQQEDERASVLPFDLLHLLAPPVDGEPGLLVVDVRGRDREQPDDERRAERDGEAGVVVDEGRRPADHDQRAEHPAARYPGPGDAHRSLA
jgi:hypothetical protein